MWVDNMVDNLNYSYLYTKRDVYYFSKHVPKDIWSHFKRDRIGYALKEHIKGSFNYQRLFD